MKSSKINDEVEGGKSSKPADKEIDMEAIRPDLVEVIDRHSFGLDERRPEAVARRKQKNQRTARANVKDLCDGRFTEYGALTIAAQRHRRSMDDLISRTPADGLIAGIGSGNGSLFAWAGVRQL
jgi:acetyl-CoA carboxylase carboxyltransferase component